MCVLCICSDIHLLLTLLIMDNERTFDVIRNLLFSELMDICFVLSLNRFGKYTSIA